MALGVTVVPFTYVVHVLGLVAIILVLVWNIHFRGGLSWDADNKNLIFNLSVSLLHFTLFSIYLFILLQFLEIQFHGK
ncbi:hypothetical protein AHAS_Ahas19G0176100 [Arachis hypogaea]